MSEKNVSVRLPKKSGSATSSRKKSVRIPESKNWDILFTQVGGVESNEAKCTSDSLGKYDWCDEAKRKRDATKDPKAKKQKSITNLLVQTQEQESWKRSFEEDNADDDTKWDDEKVSKRKKMMHSCDRCDMSFKQKGGLKQHQADVHDIGVVLHSCDRCDKSFKQKGSLKRHKADVHDIGVVLHSCDRCDMSFKQITTLKQHKANVHDIGVVWHSCDRCDMSFKQITTLKQHKANVHDIGVVLHSCDRCDMSFKQIGGLKQHKADVHDIDVVWHSCDILDCDKSFKSKRDLMTHLDNMHNKEYVSRKKIQEERVRVALRDAGSTETYDNVNIPPIQHFKREKQINFRCAGTQSNTSYCRIDFVVSTKGGLVFVEVDENQHRWGYDASIACDMKRMSHAMESMTIELGEAMPHVYWLRYNPNAYRVSDKVVNMPKVIREHRLIQWLNTFTATTPLEIGYAFYDTYNDLLDVLDNEHYHSYYAQFVDNLGELSLSPEV
jgi:uncharacterized C2H2 Zn-finger protein